MRTILCLIVVAAGLVGTAAASAAPGGAAAGRAVPAAPLPSYSLSDLLVFGLAVAVSTFGVSGLLRSRRGSSAEERAPSEELADATEACPGDPPGLGVLGLGFTGRRPV